eukprot:465744-Alexandrium_andersonii.AAC.1
MPKCKCCVLDVVDEPTICSCPTCVLPSSFSPPPTGRSWDGEVVCSPKGEEGMRGELKGELRMQVVSPTP